MTTYIGRGSWGRTEGTSHSGAHIDIILRTDGSVRARIIIARGEGDFAGYSDFFRDEEAATRWAKEIVVKWGGFNAEHPYNTCNVCGETIWPWEESEGYSDYIDEEGNESRMHPWGRWNCSTHGNKVCESPIL